MPANNSGKEARRLAARYPGHIGHLFSPGAQRGPFMEFPHHLDNGAFGGIAEGGLVLDGFSEEGWLALLQWAASAMIPPGWCLVPDFPCDAAKTLQRWERYAPIAASYGWPLAIAVQNGMKPADIPAEADVIFVGGDTEWKRATAHIWTRSFPRVHVGRVNTYKWLRYYHKVGAESCDGTGWLRGGPDRIRELIRFLDEITGKVRCSEQENLPFSCTN